MKIDIGIACNKNQEKEWWARVMPELMRLARKVEFGGFWAIGSALTDHNRNHVSKYFWDGDGDVLWWIDDDTVPPPGTLERLLALDVPIAAGLYFLRKPPCNPVAYRQRDDGFYVPLWNYQKGEILRVDSVGMGCTLIRREVYEKIVEQYRLVRRARTGSLLPVHRDDWMEVAAFSRQIKRYLGKVMVTKDLQSAVLLERLEAAGEVEVWPFYAFEYGRTEDHWFCEMARRCGFEIWVDTGIECQHWGSQPITSEQFRQMRQWHKEQFGEESGEGA